jgi:hypothetical protein
VNSTVGLHDDEGRQIGCEGTFAGTRGNGKDAPEAAVGQPSQTGCSLPAQSKPARIAEDRFGSQTHVPAEVELLPNLSVRGEGLATPKDRRTTVG